MGTIKSIQIPIDFPEIEQSSKTWDYYLWVVSWPTSSCAIASTCSIPSYVNFWTIHGLWPENYDGTYPANCNSSYPFKYSEVSDLGYDMYHYWPDLYYNSTDFWEHEWEKHGTCAMESTVVDDEHDYFSAALNLYEKHFYIDKWLSNAGIVPSTTKTYSWQQFYDALHAGLGVKAAIQCTYAQNKQMVYQIYVCVSDPDLKQFDCPDGIMNSFTCPKNDPLYYLPCH